MKHIESLSPGIVQRQAAERSGNPGLNALELTRDRKARIKRHGQHGGDDDRAKHEGARRWADEFQYEQRDEDDGAADVREQVKPAKNIAEDESGQCAAVDRVSVLQDLEGRGRDEEAQRQHAADPHDERDQRDIPDCWHPLIIIGRVDGPDMDWLVRLTLEAIESADAIDPVALRFLLRRYAATGDDELARVAGAALARVIDRDSHHASADPAAWLGVIVDAAALSDDERLRTSAAAMAERVRAGWPDEGDIASRMRGIDACLRCLPLVNPAGLASSAIDELERTIGASYKPGSGVRRDPAADGDGTLNDHVQCAHALITAYAVADRVPYGMLADDLMQFARRRWWNEAHAQFDEVDVFADDLPWFVANCEALRVCCRLAGLHADADYLRAAVVSDSADYGALVQAMISRLTPLAGRYGLGAAAFGIAVDEMQSLA